MLADISDDAAAAEAHFAAEPEFKWFSDATRSGDAAKDRSTLADHLKSLAAATESMSLADFQWNDDSSDGTGDFQYTIRKVQDDGKATNVLGKGAIDCSSGKLIVWSIGLTSG